jgi:hypothetical protein
MKLLYIIALVLLFSFENFAQEVDSKKEEQNAIKNQESKSKPDRSRIYYGGYVTMNFSTNYSIIGAQPLIAYKLTQKLSVGTQLSLEYISSKYNGFRRNGANYGFSIFSRVRVLPQLYLHSEFEMLSSKWFYSNGTSEREWIPMLFVGGGYSQPVSENIWLNAQVLFDVLNNKNSPYKNWKPYYSVGIGVGF